MSKAGLATEGGHSYSPSSEKNLRPIGEFLTENCVLMLGKIPSIRLYSPRRANPGATPCHRKRKCTEDTFGERKHSSRKKKSHEPSFIP